jgi:hypothetical protein
MKKTKNILPQLFLLLNISIFLPISLHAGAVIEVDNPKIDIGSVRKEKREIIRHLFKVKNSGDDTLKINRVKPG